MKTYGTVRLEARKLGSRGGERPAWVVQAEPHVALRLKRVFDRINKGDIGEVLLAATAETARELEWFLERFPMEVVGKEAKAFLRHGAREHARREAQVAELLATEYQAPDFAMNVPPREYQRKAADMWLRLQRLLLADDVGLGKTASALTGFTDTRTLPAVVVTLTHLPRQWQRELARFLPRLRVHVAKRATPEDVTRGRGGRKLPWPDVLILNYHKLSGWADTLASAGVRSIVFDECQELRRGPESDKYRAAHYLAERTPFVIGLSATPIYNYGGEMFHVLDALKPGVLGTREEFSREWCTGVDDKLNFKDPRSFGTYLRDAGLMLRRTRQDVGRELPSLSRDVHTVESDTRVLDEVQDKAAELARIILAQGGVKPEERLHASGELSWRLRQATGIAKAPFVAEFVRMLVENGERVLLYGWHHEVYSIWRERLAEYSPAIFTGQESPAQKEEQAKRFKDGQTPILIMSLRAGAGLDGLQHCCRTVVFGELDWSPGVHEQACGRVHRDGQPDPVMAYFLVSDSGSDPVVADVLGIKRNQMEGIRDPQASLMERLETDEGRVRKLAEAFLKNRRAA
ncbi:DEAD/DEAH box helicase [Corallococcus sp. AS-1-6]|uniref:DEAD/DEAH box helicase n=1 Tax=Corallococcus sp. AS-1-6 TaxID=2874599 RepID=UPI001CC116AF|nr:DEAD/DEAH box helicase [Corallococcus sp. AS-1-6]